jgi:2-keto-4-pentenoate hydratase/2-oxohepta-3-ene-1,7-dioic acid hydratase in catechol pathway
VVAQMTNFASHVTDAGGDPASVPLTFFRKSSGSITGPSGTVIWPAHVRLPDYEVEIGLVVAIDISARDIQLPQTQFYEAKSYPTFTPCGPALVLPDPGDLKRFADLRLTLRVNGEVRQDMTAAEATVATGDGAITLGTQHTVVQHTVVRHS